MYVKLESDLHIDKDFNYGYEPDLNNIDTYVIAGDLGQWKTVAPFIKIISEKYPKVNIIHTCGNHEYYTTYIEKPDRIFSELKNDCPNYHYLQNSSIIIDDVRFIGSTLWTSFNNRNPIDMHDALNNINDYKRIRHKNGVLKFLPIHSIRLHEIAKEYIFKTLDEFDIPTIVVTHHKPFTSSMDWLSSAYETELRNDLLDIKNPPEYWFSGHNHKMHSYDFECNDKIIKFRSNPLGYPHETTGFNSSFIIEI